MTICSHVDLWGGNQHVYYVSGAQIVELRKAQGEASTARSLGVLRVPPMSGPTSYVDNAGYQHVFYVGTSGEIFELWWAGNGATTAGEPDPTTQQAKAPLAGIVLDPTPAVAAHFLATEATHHVFFMALDGDNNNDPWEIWWRGAEHKNPERLRVLARVAARPVYRRADQEPRQLGRHPARYRRAALSWGRRFSIFWSSSHVNPEAPWRKQTYPLDIHGASMLASMAVRSHRLSGRIRTCA